MPYALIFVRLAQFPRCFLLALLDLVWGHVDPGFTPGASSSTGVIAEANHQQPLDDARGKGFPLRLSDGAGTHCPAISRRVSQLEPSF